ncbi:O-antigen polymerase [Vibrio campbellii]
MWFVFLFLGVFFYTISYLKYKDIFQPSGVGVFFWFLTCALSSYEPMYNTSLQSELSTTAVLSMLGFGVFFFMPSLLFPSVKKAQTVKLVNIGNKYRWMINVIIFITVVAFFIRFRNQLLSPAIFLMGLSDLKSEVPPGIKGLHYFDLMTPYIVLACYFEIIFSVRITRLRKRCLFVYVIFGIVTTLLYKVSRGELLTIVMGCVYLSYFRFRPSLLKLSLGVFVFLTAFMSFTYLRINEGSAVSTHLGSGSLSIFSPIYTYIAMNFENFNKLTLDSQHSFTFYWASLKFMLYPFYPEAYEGTDSIVKYIDTLFFNARTILYPFYHDLGLFGVILYSLLISFFVNWVYFQAQREVRYTLVLAYLQKAILFSFFGNYYFGELVLLFPYIIAIVLLIFSFKKVHVR